MRAATVEGMEAVLISATEAEKVIGAGVPLL